VFLFTPRGTKDFSPEYSVLFKEVTRKIEEIFRRYGFEPLYTPIVEYWETLSQKYGAEEKLVWRFKLPWTDKEYALRFDLTVPLARYYAKNRPPLPFKRYQIGRVFRYEEPQKARYREFWQADIDIIGSPYPEADAEIINTLSAVYEDFGLDYTVKLNDRKLMEILLKREGVKNFLEVCRCIDKLDKIGEEGVRKLLYERIGKEKTEKILEIAKIKTRDPSDLKEKIELEKEIEERISFLEEIYELLERKDRIVIDLSLVRGLDYYTGPVFEIWVKELNCSTAGGGRYDELIGMFLNQKIPATGGSIGVIRFLEAGIEAGIFGLEKGSYTEIGIIYEENCFKKAWEVANKLRKRGKNVYIDLLRRSVRKQMEYLKKKKINQILIVKKEKFVYIDKERSIEEELRDPEEVLKLLE